ncbi:DUF550 domain-containing protein [Enterobacter roggenkampii]|nr:DUF550 domain-containing protein [Enterobacter roggenkampii]
MRRGYPRAAALEEKLKVNMARQWPEPKDGEPRLHIKP